MPWNAQMFLTATKLGPALAAGCAVVLKASEIAPVPLLAFARLIQEAGFPAGVVSVITGDAENFGASGQSCVAGSRGLVQRSIFETLVARITEKAAGIIVGDPTEASTHIGPLCTASQITKIVATLQLAKAQGARIRFGGAPLKQAGNFMAPTLVECENHDIETLKVELFGPIMSLVPFDTEDEALALANCTPYGLGSGVFTQNLARAHRVSSRIKAGICWVNTYRAISPVAPFGGYNHSGYGREAGIDAVRDYTCTKTTWINTCEQPMANPFVMR
uniref:aldehyde dehydrogenase family protein n=1 Tax=Yoonia sp. TaxID=2212373 RepID=UPI00404707D9